MSSVMRMRLDERRGRPSRSLADRSVKAVVGSLLVTLVVLTAGCGGSPDTKDLSKALLETRAAVRSTELAVDLHDEGRTTKAAAQVTVADMVDQIGLAQRRLVKAPADTPELRDLRRQCEVVVTDALATVQDTKEALSGPADGPVPSEDLSRVEGAVDQTLTVVTKR